MAVFMGLEADERFDGRIGWLPAVNLDADVLCPQVHKVIATLTMAGTSGPLRLASDVSR